MAKKALKNLLFNSLARRRDSLPQSRDPFDEVPKAEEIQEGLNDQKESLGGSDSLSSAGGFFEDDVASPTPILFVHIPKTAGTSFRLALEEMLGSSAVCYDYGPQSSLTNALVSSYATQDLWKFKRHFDAAGQLCLAGHVAAAQYVGLFGALNTVAFVRDPVQRVLSEHQHFIRNYGYSESILDFSRDWRFQNKQQRQLLPGPWHAYGFIGLAERFDESVQLLNAERGWSLEPSEVNIGRTSLEATYEVDEPTRTAICQANQGDQALYDAVLLQFEQRLRLYSQGLPFTRGHVKEIENSFLAGWAVRANEDAVPVEFLVNGKPLKSGLACEYRSWAHALGVGRGGHVGFRVKLPGLKVGDEIICRAEDTGQSLNMLPFRVFKHSL